MANNHTRMVKINGCLIPEECECEVCKEIKPALDIEWHKVHNHPWWLACSSCREKMKSWRRLRGPSERDDPDNVRIKVSNGKGRKSISMDGMRRSRPVKTKEPAVPDSETSDAQ